MNEIFRRIEKSTELQKEFDSKLKSTDSSNHYCTKSILNHLCFCDINNLKLKYKEQLKSLILNKDAQKFKEENNKDTLINISAQLLTKSEKQVLKKGMNHSWPSRVNDLSIQIEFESGFNKIEKLPDISPDNVSDGRTKLRFQANAVIN